MKWKWNADDSVLCSDMISKSVSCHHHCLHPNHLKLAAHLAHLCITDIPLSEVQSNCYNLLFPIVSSCFAVSDLRRDEMGNRKLSQCLIIEYPIMKFMSILILFLWIYTGNMKRGRKYFVLSFIYILLSFLHSNPDSSFIPGKLVRRIF